MADEALEYPELTEGDDNDRRSRVPNQDQQQYRGPRPTATRGTYRRGYRPRRKVCIFCADKTRAISWKEADSLRRFVNDGGGMHSRRKTGTCARHQRRLAIAIKRARHMALLPYTIEHVRIMSKN